MTQWFTLARWRPRFGAGLLIPCLFLIGGCNSSDRLDPSPGSSVLSSPSFDDTETEIETGIPFAAFDLPYEMLGSFHSGAYRTPSPKSILKGLAMARASGARLVLNLSGSKDRNLLSQRSFSLAKWKAMVDRFKNVDFSSYIADGTIVGHYLIDEPGHATRWGRGGISQSTVEEMAKYSKELWPEMTTLARVVPSWLAASGSTYQSLDAGWAQYSVRKGSAAEWVASEVSVAQSLGLGLIVSLNVLNGGNGSSRTRGRSGGQYSMSAREIAEYGNALLDQSYACAFLMWRYDSKYFGRPAIRDAMAALSAKAQSHPRTSCSQ